MELLFQGKVNGYVCQGFNRSLVPRQGRTMTGLGKLKFLVTIDPLVNETSEFWQNHGELNDVDPTQIQFEVFPVPFSCFAEEDGSLVSSSLGCARLEGRQPPAEAKGDLESVGEIYLTVKSLYARGARGAPTPS